MLFEQFSVRSLGKSSHKPKSGGKVAKTSLCINLGRLKWIRTRTGISIGQDSKQRHVVRHSNDVGSIESGHHFVFCERCKVVDVEPTRNQCGASMWGNQLAVEMWSY
jgi:hypothetical protein